MQADSSVPTPQAQLICPCPGPSAVARGRLVPTHLVPQQTKQMTIFWPLLVTFPHFFRICEVGVKYYYQLLIARSERRSCTHRRLAVITISCSYNSQIARSERRLQLHRQFSVICY